MPKFNFKIDEIALVLIVAFVAMAVGISDKTSKPEMGAEKITEIILDDHEISFANDGVIDENKLRQVQNMDYKEFKNHLNARNDFCIYIEGVNGNIILAKGSSKLSKDQLRCRE